MQGGALTEEELKQMLVGKQFYLRGGYLGDTLNFDERGHVVGHPQQGSYTLSVLQIDHVRLTKHKVELEGVRYGLHFNEQLAYEDSSTAFDKVRITPKKKVVRVTIDREMVVSPRKKKEPSPERNKEKDKDKAKAVKPASPPVSGPAAPSAAATPPAQEPSAASSAAPAAASAAALSPAPSTSPAAESSEPSDADQLKASIAATPAAERPADPSSVTTTTSQSHANKMLRDAIDAALAPGLDDRMMAAMPDFWKFYYQAVANKADYRPADPSILRQNTVDQKAHLLTSFEPGSNDFAQAAGVAGMALYHTVIGPDGKPGEIAVARPIGFGLDESAVAAIRKAKFSPAMKGGQPVSVMLDLVVQFRIFSNRTGAPAQADAPAQAETTADKVKPPEPVLPGPYSVPHPN
jgi:TonB family protein